jgi:hypothetical protein
MRLLPTLSSLLLLACSGNAFAITELEVTQNGNSGPGSLRDALLTVDAGLDPDGDYRIHFDLAPGSAYISLLSPLPGINQRRVEIAGWPQGAAPGSGTRPTISGENTVRLFALGPNVEQFRLAGVELESGRGAGRAGCIDLVDAAPTAAIEIDDVGMVACRNIAASGIAFGGAIGGNGELQVSNSQVQHNLSEGPNAAGAAIGMAAGSLVLTHSLVSSNLSRATAASGLVVGGGIATAPGVDVTVADTAFLDNYTVTQTLISVGGGLYCQSSNCNAHRSEFSGNRARLGAGLAIYDETVPGLGDDYEASVSDSLFIANLSAGGGALLVLGNYALTLRNITMDSNALLNAQPELPGVANLYLEGLLALEAAHSLLLGPTGQNTEGVDPGAACGIDALPPGFVPSSTNLASDDSCDVLGATALANNAAAFGLSPSQMPAVGFVRPLPLLAGSPAIDAGSAEAPSDGDPAACAQTDLTGRARPQDGDLDGTPRCDIGAVEFTLPGIFSDGFEQP